MSTGSDVQNTEALQPTKTVEDAEKPVASKSSMFGNINDLIKALIWPVLILYVLLRYQSPISDTIDLLPNLIKHATKFSAGGVTLEIEQRAQESGNENLAIALKGLSPEARKLLLQVGDSYWTEWGKGVQGEYLTYRQTALNELVERKLVDFRPEGHGAFQKWIQGLGSISSTDGDATAPKMLRPNRTLSQEEEKRLLNEQFFLSPLGKKAYDVILDVVVHS